MSILLLFVDQYCPYFMLLYMYVLKMLWVIELQIFIQS